jgi:hypothetical protein
MARLLSKVFPSFPCMSLTCRFVTTESLYALAPIAITSPTLRIIVRDSSDHMVLVRLWKDGDEVNFNTDARIAALSNTPVVEGNAEKIDVVDLMNAGLDFAMGA